MEVISPLPLLALPIAMSFVAGAMAKDYGRSYSFWFWLAIPLPFIAHFILLSLPDKKTEDPS
jgi:hypothetical protein